MAVSYAVNDAVVVMDGTLGTNDTSGSVAYSVDRVSIGSFNARGNAYGYLNSTISRIRYYPRRLPNATLQSLTS